MFRPSLRDIHDLVSQGSELYFVIATCVGVAGVAYSLIKRLSPAQKADYGIQRIAYHFRNQNVIQIHGLCDEPDVEIVGRTSLTAEQKLFAQNWVADKPDDKPNDPHALCVEDPDWSAGGEVVIKAEALKYAEVKALLEPKVGDRHTIRLVSAQALIVCPSTKELILHRRSPNSRTYKNCLHTMGGGYMPQGIGEKWDVSLRSTAIREVNEEADLRITLPNKTKILAMDELKTGWIQVAFLGAKLSREDITGMRKNPNPMEGRPVRVTFADLPEMLRKDRWVPTGKAAVLAWLALGARNGGWRPIFGRERKWTARELFEDIVKSTHLEPSDIEESLTV